MDKHAAKAPQPPAKKLIGEGPWRVSAAEKEKYYRQGYNTCALGQERHSGESSSQLYGSLARGKIHDDRERQLHDEAKSCGSQPAYIRVIKRRLKPLLLESTRFRPKGDD